VRLLAWLLRRWCVRRYRYERGAWRSSLEPRFDVQSSGAWRRNGGAGR